MRLITAIVRAERLDAVRSALEAAGVGGLTVSQAAGYGRQRGHRQVFRGAAYASDLVEKVRLDIVSDDAAADGITGAIVTAAQTGQPGDGKIWVQAVEEVIRVSDGQTGSAAL